MDIDITDMWTLYWDHSKNDPMRNDLIEYYAPFAEKLAIKFQKNLPRQYTVEQAISDAYVALMDAVPRYEHGHSAKFETFVSPRIFGAIMDSLRQQDFLTRGARAEGCTMSSLDTPVLIQEFETFGSLLADDARESIYSEMDFDDQKLLWYATERGTSEAGLLRHFQVNRSKLVMWMDRVISEAKQIIWAAAT